MKRTAIHFSASNLMALVMCAALPVVAKEVKIAPPKKSAGAAYIDQIGAPADWKTNAHFWAGLSTSVPSDIPPIATLKLVISDPGNTVKQVQTGTAQREFVMQWGSHNSASQTLSGSGDRAEAVQISPGAALTAKANAGAGNGGEFDVFGFEIDPGNSGIHNHSPEAGRAGTAPSSGNTAVQQSAGTGNLERAVQIGWNNTAEQVQRGTADQSVIVQIGSGNHAENEQIGASEESTIIQQGSANIAIVHQ